MTGAVDGAGQDSARPLAFQFGVLMLPLTEAMLPEATSAGKWA